MHDREQGAEPAGLHRGVPDTTLAGRGLVDADDNGLGESFDIVLS